MDRIEQQRIAAILLHAPAWARLGLAVRDERLRERAADTLAGIIAAKLGRVFQTGEPTPHGVVGIRGPGEEAGNSPAGAAIE
jgi:hypothetical protein